MTNRTNPTHFIHPDHGGQRATDRETALLEELEQSKKQGRALLSTIIRLERELIEAKSLGM